MKNFFLLILCLLFFTDADCQSGLKSDSNSIVYPLSLKEYKIDSCLFYLFTDIEDSDSSNMQYSPSKFFYDVAFYKKEKIRELRITPSRWLKAESVNYSGIIIINKMTFLCRGDIEDDILFCKTNCIREIILKKPKIYQYDDVDLMIDMYIRSPALMGRYEVCPGLPINVYVYTGKKLEGYNYKQSQ